MSDLLLRLAALETAIAQVEAIDPDEQHAPEQLSTLCEQFKTQNLI